MGCDIHMFKEKLVDGKWVSADEWVSYDYGDDEKGMDVPFQKRFHERNYDLFSILAGVRTRNATGLEQTPRGLPFDASPEVAADFKRWDGDAHSASFMYVHELKSLNKLLSEKMMPISGMKAQTELDALNASIASGSPNWDLLYPYCQWASHSDYAEFRIDIPASYIVGGGLDRLIAMFDGIDGENHRVVFWFDN